MFQRVDMVLVVGMGEDRELLLSTMITVKLDLNPSCVTLSELLTLSVPLYLYKVGGKNSTYLIECC